MVKSTTRLRMRICFVAMAFTLLGVLANPIGAKVWSASPFKLLSIPILGLTINKSEGSIGVVSYVVLHFQDRGDQEGLRLRFEKLPGKFSPSAQHAVKLAIERAAAAANLGLTSWTVRLTFPYSGMTLYGDSLSAMVGLSVVALAKGDIPIYGRSITGTITEDGRIGTVGGVPQKVRGAHQYLKRVLIPDEHHVGDSDWSIPFLMHVSPVNTVEKAYLGLTGHQLASSITMP